MTLANRLGRVTARTITVVLVGALLLLGQAITRAPAAHALGLASASAEIKNLTNHRVSPFLLQQIIEHDVFLRVEGFAPNRQLSVVATSTAFADGAVANGAGVLTATLLTDSEGKAEYDYEFSFMGVLPKIPGTMHTILVNVTCADVGEATVANDTDSMTAAST